MSELGNVNEAESLFELIVLLFKRDYFYKTQCKNTFKWPFLAQWGAYLSGVAILLTVLTVGGPMTGTVSNFLQIVGAFSLFASWFLLFAAHPVVSVASKVWRLRNGYAPHADS
jgi:hypothetical protein